MHAVTTESNYALLLQVKSLVSQATRFGVTGVTNYNHNNAVNSSAPSQVTVDNKVDGNNTLLHLSVIYDLPECVVKLLSVGADPDERNNDGLSSIDLALDAGNQQLLQLLSRRGDFLVHLSAFSSEILSHLDSVDTQSLDYCFQSREPIGSIQTAHSSTSNVSCDFLSIGKSLSSVDVRVKHNLSSASDTAASMLLKPQFTDMVPEKSVFNDYVEWTDSSRRKHLEILMKEIQEEEQYLSSRVLALHKHSTHLSSMQQKLHNELREKEHALSLQVWDTVQAERGCRRLLESSSQRVYALKQRLKAAYNHVLWIGAAPVSPFKGMKMWRNAQLELTGAALVITLQSSRAVPKDNRSNAVRYSTRQVEPTNVSKLGNETETSAYLPSFTSMSTFTAALLSDPGCDSSMDNSGIPVHEPNAKPSKHLNAVLAAHAAGNSTDEATFPVTEDSVQGTSFSNTKLEKRKEPFISFRTGPVRRHLRRGRDSFVGHFIGPKRNIPIDNIVKIEINRPKHSYSESKSYAAVGVHYIKDGNSDFAMDGYKNGIPENEELASDRLLSTGSGSASRTTDTSIRNSHGSHSNNSEIVQECIKARPSIPDRPCSSYKKGSSPSSSKETCNTGDNFERNAAPVKRRSMEKLENIWLRFPLHSPYISTASQNSHTESCNTGYTTSSASSSTMSRDLGAAAGLTPTETSSILTADQFIRLLRALRDDIDIFEMKKGVQVPYAADSATDNSNDQGNILSNADDGKAIASQPDRESKAEMIESNYSNIELELPSIGNITTCEEHTPNSTSPSKGKNSSGKRGKPLPMTSSLIAIRKMMGTIYVSKARHYSIDYPVNPSPYAKSIKENCVSPYLQADNKLVENYSLFPNKNITEPNSNIRVNVSRRFSEGDEFQKKSTPGIVFAHEHHFVKIGSEDALVEEGAQSLVTNAESCARDSEWYCTFSPSSKIDNAGNVAEIIDLEQALKDEVKSVQVLPKKASIPQSPPVGSNTSNYDANIDIRKPAFPSRDPCDDIKSSSVAACSPSAAALLRTDFHQASVRSKSIVPTAVTYLSSSFPARPYEPVVSAHVDEAIDLRYTPVKIRHKIDTARYYRHSATKRLVHIITERELLLERVHYLQDLRKVIDNPPEVPDPVPTLAKLMQNEFIYTAEKNDNKISQPCLQSCEIYGEHLMQAFELLMRYREKVKDATRSFTSVYSTPKSTPLSTPARSKQTPSILSPNFRKETRRHSGNSTEVRSIQPKYEPSLLHDGSETTPYGDDYSISCIDAIKFVQKLSGLSNDYFRVDLAPFIETQPEISNPANKTILSQDECGTAISCTQDKNSMHLAATKSTSLATSRGLPPLNPVFRQEFFQTILQLENIWQLQADSLAVIQKLLHALLLKQQSQLRLKQLSAQEKTAMSQPEASELYDIEL